MNLIEWESKYCLKIKEIDEQHKKLINLANKLFNACTQGKDIAEEEFKNAIKEAVDYAKSHFKFEEELLSKYNYPEINEHRKEHEDFIKKIILEIKNFETGKKFVPNSFARFLRDWTLEHIAISDKKFSFFLKSKGLQ